MNAQDRTLRNVTGDAILPVRSSCEGQGSRHLPEGSQLQQQRLLDVLLADAGAFLRRAEGRRVEFHGQPTLPADLIEVCFQGGKIHTAGAEGEERGIVTTQVAGSQKSGVRIQESE